MSVIIAALLMVLTPFLGAWLNAGWRECQRPERREQITQELSPPPVKADPTRPHRLKHYPWWNQPIPKNSYQRGERR